MTKHSRKIIKIWEEKNDIYNDLKEGRYSEDLKQRENSRFSKVKNPSVPIIRKNMLLKTPSIKQKL